MLPGPSSNTVARMIEAGQGDTPANLVIGDVRILDIVTGALTPSDIAIIGDHIVGTHDQYEARDGIDGRGRAAVPGLIDTHLHVESSLRTPLEFDRSVLPHGATTALCDPHEIANVPEPGRTAQNVAERQLLTAIHKIIGLCVCRLGLFDCNRSILAIRRPTYPLNALPRAYSLLTQTT